MVDTFTVIGLPSGSWPQNMLDGKKCLYSGSFPGIAASLLLPNMAGRFNCSDV